MTTTYQTNITDTTYNGWANYETWNVALWLQNDEGLNYAVSLAGDYESLVEMLAEGGNHKNPDGVKWNDPKINIIEINSEVFDF